MAGNVWEWTADYYGETFYQNSPGQNPTGPATGEGRVFRGGSWASASKKWMMLVSTFYRLWNYPTNRSDVIGFRCATNNPQLGGGSINNVTTPEASQVSGQATAEPGFYNFYACGNPCNGNPTLALQQFPKKTKFIYLNWTYENVPAGAHYDRVWSVDGREWVRYDCSWNGPSNGQESDLKLWDMQGLTSGTWTLSIFIDGRNVLQESLEVLGNWNIWTPAGTFNTCYGSR